MTDLFDHLADDQPPPEDDAARAARMARVRDHNRGVAGVCGAQVMDDGGSLVPLGQGGAPVPGGEGS